MAPPIVAASVMLPAAGLEDLRAEAHRDGFRFVGRLLDDCESGANRFDRPGEILLGAWEDGRLVGIGGLNRDPDRPGAGRVRHLYVLRRARRSGTGSLLLDGLVEAARPSFRRLRLRTEAEAAAAFYLARGFVPVAETGATHALELR